MYIQISIYISHQFFKHQLIFTHSKKPFMKTILSFLFALLFVSISTTSVAQCTNATATQVQFGSTCFVLITGFPANVFVGIYNSAAPPPGLVASTTTDASGNASVPLPTCIPSANLVSFTAQGGICVVPVTGFTTLPIKISTIQLQKKQGSTEIIWQIENDEINAFQQVEKSVDGITFNTIHTFKSTNPTSQTKVYSYVDASDNVTHKYVYYRVKVTNVSGVAKYSSIVKASTDAAFSQVTILQNPIVGNKIILNVPSQSINTNYQISDATGKQISKGVLKGTIHTIDFNAPSGIYNITILSNTGITHVRFLK